MTLEAKSAAPLMYGAVYSDAPAMSWAGSYFYVRFQHHAPFYTRPAPPTPITWADIAAIYAELPPVRSQPVSSHEDHI